MLLSALESLTAGPYGWVPAEHIKTGITALLDKPYIAEDTTGTGISTYVIPPIFGASIAKTITFTAPVDCTIRNLVSFPIIRVEDAPNGTITYDNFSKVVVGTITVAGTGPDVGSLMDGYGIPGQLFSVANMLVAPQLNIRMNAGDTVAFTIYQTSGTSLGGQLPYQAVLTYDTGIDTSVKPTRFIGGAAPPFLPLPLVSGTAASGVITVTGTPTSPGDTITLYSEIGLPVSIEGSGGVFTGQSGAIDTDTWDTDVVGVTAIRDEILSKLSSSNWTQTYDFTDNGGSTDEILVTRKLAGPYGNFDQFTVSSANLSASGPGFLTGGVASTVSSSFATPTVDTTLSHLLIGQFNNGAYPSQRTNNPPEVTGFTVNASPVDIPVSLADTGISLVRAVPLNEPVLIGDALGISARGHFGSTILFVCLAGTAT